MKQIISTFGYFHTANMRIYILFGWVFLLQATSILSQSDTKYKRYTRLTERYFDEQNLDSCLHYNYILAHYYLNDSDSTGLVTAWYNIAIINLLQEKYAKAQAARQIANKFVKGNSNIYNELEYHYCNILNVKTHFDKPYLSISQGEFKEKSKSLYKFYYLEFLLKAEYEYRNNHYTKSKIILHNLITELKKKGDINLFAFAKANMLMGEQFFNVNDFIHCVSFYETAIRIYEANHIFNNDLITTYCHYHYVLLATGQGEKRDSCFQSIDKINLIKKNRAGYYFVKGEYMRYTSYQEAIDAYLQSYYSKDVNAEIMSKLQKKIIYLYVLIGQYDKALKWLKNLDTNSMNDYEKLRIAFSYCKLGNTDKGNALIKQVENKKVLDVENQLYWLAKYYFETKNYDKAEIYYTRYLQYLIKTYGVDYYKSFAYSALGYFYWYGRANYQRSLEYYHKAVYQLVNEQAPDDLYKIPDINKSISDDEFARELSNEAEAFYEVSKLQKTKAGKLRDLNASLANLEASFSIAQRYKMSLSRDEQRYEYADNIKYRYPYVINVCMDLYHETGNLLYAHKAFEYAEKSKASLLLSTMRGVNASRMHLLPDELKIKEEQLWSKTELFSRYLSESYQSPEINRKRIDQYNISLNILRRQQDSLIQIFKTKYTAYYNARYNADVTSVVTLQTKLNPDEVVLEYSLSNNKLVIFVLTRNNFKIFTDTLEQQFFKDVEIYYKTLSVYSFNYNNSSVKTFARASNHLYNQLIKPAESDIKGKKLLIIPDDVLNQIPFETLLTKPLLDTDKAMYVKLSYLIKEHVISYSYSGTLHAMNNRTLTYHNAKLLAVAPYYDKAKLLQLIAKDLPSSQRDSIDMNSIPGIYNEVKAIHQLFGGRILMKNKATKENFKEMSPGYEILHLATHGAANEQYPMFSKLLFTVGKDSLNDGLLNTYEIYNMQINAPLVVLSACNTGYGALHKGEGVISLSRGFFTAGAKTIVMTLWPAFDEASSKLMKYFYENLAANQSVGDALYHAKLKYLEKCDPFDAHPSLWAGYIVLGNASVNFEPYHSKTKYYIWISLALLTIAGIIFREKLRLILVLKKPLSL